MSSGPATLPSPRRADINLRNVSFTYPGSSETGLARYLIAHPGETIAMIGENGAGKTTLVKLLARLYDPDTGAIEFDGADLRTLSLDDLHKQIGFVFQDFNRFEATAAVSPMAIGGLCPATGKGSKKSGVWRGWRPWCDRCRVRHGARTSVWRT
jgi:ABC-type siderophore export system fused ATPase/permease subunit